MRKVALCLAALLALASCKQVIVGPEGFIRLVPPAMYRTWWEEVKTCSGLNGEIGRVEWFAVGGDRLWGEGDGRVAGAWFEPHTIVIASTWIFNERVVKHESLHDLIARGDPRHEHPAWDACDLR